MVPSYDLLPYSYSSHHKTLPLYYLHYSNYHYYHVTLSVSITFITTATTCINSNVAITITISDTISGRFLPFYFMSGFFGLYKIIETRIPILSDLG